jgi:transcriptional regulatory protein LevR
VKYFMEVLNLMKLINLREIFLKNIVDEEIIEIIDFLGPHKVMVSHLSFIRRWKREHKQITN